MFFLCIDLKKDTDTNFLSKLLEGYAPFLSMSLRESFLTVKDSVAAAPGPSTYNPKVHDHVTGGSTLSNQANRFLRTFEETPGPGHYTLTKDTDWKKNNKLNSFDDYQGQVSFFFFSIYIYQFQHDVDNFL